MGPKDAETTAISVDPDQTALFAKTYISRLTDSTLHDLISFCLFVLV